MQVKTFLYSSAIVAALGACGHSFGSQSETGFGNDPTGVAMNRLGEQASVRAGGAQFSDDIFVGASAETNNAALLPASVQSSGAIHLQSRDPMSLSKIAQRLTTMTGIPIILALGPTGQLVGATDSTTKDASSISGAQDSKNALDANNGRIPPAIVTTTSSAKNTTGQQSNDTGSAVDAIRMRPNLNGSLSDVLDQVANTFDVSWTYSDGRILIRDYITRKYQISALPGKTSSSVGIGANNFDFKSSSETDVWGDVADTLKGLVGQKSVVSISKSTGMVTVTSTISDQNRVAQYIKQINGIVGQQVQFDVNVFSVSLNKGSDAGLDISAALNRSDVSASYAGASQSQSDAVGAMNISVISGSVSVNAILKALKTEGQVSVKTRTGALTSNNRPVPINVLDEKGYVKSYTVTTDANGNDTSSPQTDTVSTGFQMQLMPRVMNNKDIMVQFSVLVSELNDIATFGTGDNAVQLPETSTTSFEQQAVVRNGQTLVLAGFERERKESDKSAGFKGFLGLGGNKSSSSSRVATVIMITPHILSSDNSNR